ncbi:MULTISPECIES: CAP domain-containing protein [Tenacibaculum]|uniref:CAP domain-containing protein n=1 Tax=Tenacibaculum TaxID=104267 RepID=UPI001F0A34F0|nr:MULTISPECIES: CAP domain-containing protein [Tenacibaculum]MCH3882027.1 CAP domain-containing protein [Tenacibaculum aquimarinum]MDO6599668.1 CAP domain-containing protein [Tenacibaculum sp. 1_MG-2023]
MFTSPKQKFLPIALCLIFFITSCSSSEESVVVAAEEPVVEYIAPSSLENEILNRINDYRVSINLPVLNNFNIVKVPALTHTHYMIGEQEVSHDGFLTRANYLVENADVISAAENVASGYTTAEGVVDAWIASDGHRANIEGDYNYFDVIARKDSDGRWYYTNIFVKKP